MCLTHLVDDKSGSLALLLPLPPTHPNNRAPATFARMATLCVPDWAA